MLAGVGGHAHARMLMPDVDEIILLGLVYYLKTRCQLRRAL